MKKRGRPRMFENTRMFTFHVPVDLYMKLEKFTQERKITMAEFIRRTIQEKISENFKENYVG